MQEGGLDAWVERPKQPEVRARVAAEMRTPTDPKSNPHPRAYGNFARFLGHYARDEQLVPLEEAVRRLTALPAQNLRLEQRGRLAPSCFADLVVFDPATISDHATFESPHQLSTGVEHVFVNGAAVLRDGQPTGATPGRVLRGPGWKH